MGFMIAHTMASYGQPYREVMSLPMRVFWALNGFIPRLAATNALMDLQIATSAQSDEGARGLAERLSRMAPEPVKRTVKATIFANSQRDEAGVARLRAMMQ